MNALKQLNASQQEPLNDFKAYLEQSLRNPFTLNLKDCSLVEVILACAKARSKLHKSYHKTISGLLYNIRLLEAEYRTTLQPIQVTDVFWGYFIGFGPKVGYFSK